MLNLNQTSMQRILPVLVGVLLLSCNNEEPALTDSAPEQSYMPADSALNEPVVYSTVQMPLETKDIAGKWFDFGPDLDTSILESYGECDCCMDDFLFLEDGHFVRISYCMADQAVYNGTYLLENGELVLNYHQTMVNRIYDEEMHNAAISTGESLYSNTVEQMEPFSEKLTAWKCKSQFFLRSNGTKTYYGTEDREVNMKSEIEFLRIDGSWDLLEW